MVNSHLLTFVFCAVGGFTGALIGNAFTKTSYFLADAPTTTTVAGNSRQCPPCPRCTFNSGSGSDEAPAAGSDEAPPSGPDATGEGAQASDSAESSAESSESAQAAEESAASSSGALVASSDGQAVAHGPAPAPPGSYSSQNFYPLRHTHNRFEHWYDQRKVGKGVWKWTQYFPAWERHFAKFVAKSWAGEEVHMAELGIFSGGSLEMWQNVFGPGLRLWGVDIATVTKQYERDDKSGRTKIFNMDQTNAAQWDEFKKLVPKLDILVDDGLHLFSGQKATFDNILDHIAPGGVFMTEDISDGARPGQPPNGRLNADPQYKEKYLDYSFAKTRALHYERSRVQNHIDSIHYYPYLFVIEKREVPLRPHGRGAPLAAIKHGTNWKPITHGVVKGEHAR